MLRHQLNVYQRRQPRPKLRPTDRWLWAWTSRVWPGWREALKLVKPATVTAWQRKRFRDYWARLSQHRGPGRPAIANEVQDLIKQLSRANVGWGVPRIVGELRKLGIHVAKSTVEKYRVKHPKSPSPTWKSFMTNHITDFVAIDFLVVPTINFKVLYVLVVLTHQRREVIYFNVTEHPTFQWVAQQMVEAFPWDTPAICSAIAMRSMANAFADECTVSSSKKLSPHRGARGKIRTWKGSSEVSAAIVWTT